jgi:hypothetical protein
MKGARALLWVSCAALGTSCGPAAVQPEDAMTVTNLIPQIDALNGRMVAVKGYLGLCMGYDCSLFEDKGDSDKWDKRTKAIMAKKPPYPPDPPMLGIWQKGDDFDKEFDRKAAELSYSYVIITGKVTNRCRYRGMPACTDRGSDIIPTDIMTWHRPARATGDRKGARK